MTDPAIEAAQRAWSGEGWIVPMERYQNEAELAAAAAREMAKPIREWMAELDSEEMLPAHVVIAALAPLIYTTEELGQ